MVRITDEERESLRREREALKSQLKSVAGSPFRDLGKANTIDGSNIPLIDRIREIDDFLNEDASNEPSK